MQGMAFSFLRHYWRPLNLGADRAVSRVANENSALAEHVPGVFRVRLFCGSIMNFALGALAGPHLHVRFSCLMPCEELVIKSSAARRETQTRRNQGEAL